MTDAELKLISSLLIPLENAAHALEGIQCESSDPSYEKAGYCIDQVIAVLENLTGTDFEAIETDDAMHRELEFANETAIRLRTESRSEAQATQ